MGLIHILNLFRERAEDLLRRGRSYELVEVAVEHPLRVAARSWLSVPLSSRR